MKASELIQKLQASIDEHGDLPVEIEIAEHEFGEPVAGIGIAFDEDGKVETFLILDADGMDSGEI